MRVTPCVSTPRRFAQTRTSATTAASGLGSPARAKTSVAKRVSAAALTDPGVVLMGSGRGRKVLVQPVAHQVYHQRIAFGEHEVVDVGDQVEVGGLAGPGEQLDRLLGGRHRVARR